VPESYTNVVPGRVAIERSSTYCTQLLAASIPITSLPLAGAYA
jgi:hypothetical protein